MNIEQIFMKPVATPEYPDPTEMRRTIRDDNGFYGYDNVFLEDATWNALHYIARDRNCTVDDICAAIELNFAPGEPFAPAARAYVLHYIAEHIPPDSELPSALVNFLSVLGARRSVQ
jgi:predicted DNA-binding ribbon-helix-helix protein